MTVQQHEAPVSSAWDIVKTTVNIKSLGRLEYAPLGAETADGQAIPNAVLFIEDRDRIKYIRKMLIVGQKGWSNDKVYLSLAFREIPPGSRLARGLRAGPDAESIGAIITCFDRRGGRPTHLAIHVPFTEKSWGMIIDAKTFYVGPDALVHPYYNPKTRTVGGHDPMDGDVQMFFYNSIRDIGDMRKGLEYIKRLYRCTSVHPTMLYDQAEKVKSRFTEQADAAALREGDPPPPLLIIDGYKPKAPGQKLWSLLHDRT